VRSIRGRNGEIKNSQILAEDVIWTVLLCALMCSRYYCNVIIIAVRVKSADTPTEGLVIMYFLSRRYFTHCIRISF
jgi:hypothetical protein